jgi:hypothetical protein
MRKASLRRETTETQIQLTLTIEGRGRYEVSTGIRFLDHMLELFARRSIPSELQGVERLIAACARNDAAAVHLIAEREPRLVSGGSVANSTIAFSQLGGQEYSEVIFFETPSAVADFEKGKVALSAQVAAVALKSGASADAKYKEGVAVFTATKGGLMADASVGGQKFGYEPFARPQ